MKRFKKLYCVLLTFILVIGVTMTTFAATPKKITATSKYKTVLTKTGNYTLTNMKDFQIGGVRFKAPKSGYYTFTFYDCTYPGEDEDALTEEYWEEFGSMGIDPNCTVCISILSGSDSHGWSCVDFDGERTFWLYNPRNIFYHMWLYGDYENMAEAGEAVANGDVSDEEILEMLRGGAGKWDLKVKLKKGQVIKLQTQGAKCKTTCNLKVKYSSKK